MKHASIQDPDVMEEYPMAMAARVGSRFQVQSPLEAYDFPDKGNIHRDTFLLSCGRDGSTREYLLQRINQQVFTRPWTVMDAMLASLTAQRSSLNRQTLPEGRKWEVIRLVPTHDGAPYLECQDRRGTTYWRLMEKIPDCRSFKSLGEVDERSGQLSLAEEAGRGLAMYGDFTAEMDVSKLENPLPGYRDTQLYFDQLLSVLEGNRTMEDASSFLPEDATLRHSSQEHFLVHLSDREYQRRKNDPELIPFIEFTEKNQDLAMKLVRARTERKIRTVGIHGDTKLENFLFSSQTRQVVTLVDLDTIMPQTWLVDWGDMVRSLTNVAGEIERDVSKIQVDMDVYEAVARGFLSTAQAVTAEEVALMVDAVEIIALELGVRFLADYLRGDNYFQLGPADPPDLNKVRALVQLTLVERLRAEADRARSCIKDTSATMQK